jgi:hypothetical protein
MPNPFARWATSWPMRPKPRMPRVLSISSTPENFERSQRPALSEPWAWGMLRASASSSAIVCSAAVTTLDSGALATMMPRLVAAGTSTLSTPTPARPIALSCVARSMTSAVSFVAERMRMPSYSAIRSRWSPSSTSKCSLSSATPEAPICSATRTFMPASPCARAPSRCMR